MHVSHRRRKRGGGGQHILWPPNNPPICTGKTIPLNSILEFSIILYFKMRNVIIWHWLIINLMGTRRRNDVDATSLRRIDVVTTSCACWEFGPPLPPPPPAQKKFKTLAPPIFYSVTLSEARKVAKLLSRKTNLKICSHWRAGGGSLPNNILEGVNIPFAPLPQ